MIPKLFTCLYFTLKLQFHRGVSIKYGETAVRHAKTILKCFDIIGHNMRLLNTSKLNKFNLIIEQSKLFSQININHSDQDLCKIKTQRARPVPN